jgi:endonuclease III
VRTTCAFSSKTDWRNRGRNDTGETRNPFIGVDSRANNGINFIRMKSAPPCAPSKAQAIPRTIRVTRLIERFREVYPTAHCELDFSNPLELLVATILSAQCTDKRVNIVTKDLFRRFRTAKDYADVPQEELENAIRSTGFYRNKAKSIRSMAKDLVERHQSQVPSTMAALVALAGVGRKTANVVLGNAFQVNEGIVVDTHVTRLAHRLGLTKRTEPEKIEQELMRLVPRTDWTDFSHWLIWHGRRRCTALGPDCENCEVANLCPSCGRAGRKKARKGGRARSSKAESRG